MTGVFGIALIIFFVLKIFRNVDTEIPATTETITKLANERFEDLVRESEKVKMKFLGTKYRGGDENVGNATPLYKWYPKFVKKYMHLNRQNWKCATKLKACILNVCGYISISEQKPKS